MGKGSSALERAESDNRLRYQHMLTYSPDECYDKIKNKRAHFDQNSVICTHSVQPEQYLLTGDSGMLSLLGRYLREMTDHRLSWLAPACQLLRLNGT